MTTMRQEQPEDRDVIRALHCLAFGGSAEAQLVDELRAEGSVRLSLVADVDGAVVGHVLFSALPITAEHEVIEALALAPVAVTPAHQRRGIGSALIREGLTLVAEAGYPAVIVLGDPAFYGRFGFRAALAESIDCPYSGPYLMGLELKPGALNDVRGEAHYPPPFDKL